MPNNADYYKVERITRNVVFALTGISLALGLGLLFAGYGEERILGLFMLSGSIATTVICFIWNTVEDIAIEARNLRMMKEHQQQPPTPTMRF